NQLSVTAWVSPQDLETDRFSHIIRKASGRFGSGYLFAFQNRGRELSLGINNSAGEESNTAIEPSYFAGDRWHFVAGTYDGRSFRIYVDGRLIGTQPLMQTINPSQDDPLFIGSYWRGQYFQGGIDDLRLYNRALTTSEIEQLYQQERPLEAPTSPTTTTPPTAPIPPPSVPSQGVTVPTTAPPTVDAPSANTPSADVPGSNLPAPPPPNQTPIAQPVPVPPAEPLPTPPAVVSPTTGDPTDNLPSTAPAVMPSEAPSPAPPPPDTPAVITPVAESPVSTAPVPTPIPTPTAAPTTVAPVTAEPTAPDGALTAPTAVPPVTEQPVTEQPVTETPSTEPGVAPLPATPEPEQPPEQAPTSEQAPAGRIILPPALTPEVCQVQVANYFAESRRLVIPALQIALLDSLTREPTGEVATFAVTLTHEPDGTVFTIATSSVSLLEESEVELACRANYDGQRIHIPLLEADAYIESLPGVRLPAPRQRLELVLEQNGVDDRTFKVESFELR
ncbi:MAG: LamG-like jellyroll fold domain-containing protein, partial [Deinococcota bacterium]